MAASFFSKLPSFEKQLVIYGIGGYSVWALGTRLTGDPTLKHAHENVSKNKKEKKSNSCDGDGTTHNFDDKRDSKGQLDSLKTASMKTNELSGANDPMVLFALQDIQSRLTVIEKALRL